jgi:hypothetical protein
MEELLLTQADSTAENERDKWRRKEADRRNSKLDCNINGA